MQGEDKNSFDKYLNGNAGANQQARIENLLATGKDKEGIRDYITNDWNNYMNSDEQVEKDLDNALGRIHHTIHLNEGKKDKTVTRKIIQWYSAAAAVILIPLLIAGIIGTLRIVNMNSLLSEKSSVAIVTSPPGARVSFKLPDGTKGVLNGGSTIEYSVPFQKNRNVKLVGEAFFDVKHDKQHPFLVDANLIDIKVLGTQFNVYGC